MEYLEQFLTWLQDEGKDEKTIKAYSTSLTQFFTWLSDTTGETDVKTIKPIDIKEFLGYLKHNRNLSQATINKATSALKTFFAYLLNQGITTDNPMTRIKLQKIQPTEQAHGTNKWLTKEEQGRFISYVDLEKNEFKRFRNLAIVDLMLYAGLRVSEVSDLKVSDVKLNGNAEITIREGKKGKYANVLLVDKHSKNLRRWLKYRSTLDKDLYSDSPYLFVSERTGQITPRGIQMMVDKYSKLANMEQVNCHRFRHSFCKNLANVGVSIQTIAELARHESIETSRIYLEGSHTERVNTLNKI